MYINKLINVNYHGGLATERLIKKNIKLVAVAILLTARQLREFVLPAQPTGFLSRLLVGSCHGGKLVWLSFCRHGARGFWSYRGTSSSLIEDSIV